MLTCGMPFGAQLHAAAIPSPQNQSQAAVTIKGTVLDENNEPVIGASVTPKGKTQGAVTDFDGNFTLRVAPGQMLHVSYVGYANLDIAAKDGMTIYMQPTTEMLNEVVAIGYGTQKRANLTGAVATVDVARTMESRPVQDVTKALQGAVPGLTITNSTGGISSSATIRVRGTGTLTNGQSSDPLIVVDGVPVDNLNFVNPEDIQEISVLKDASSSAIYGTRAAFGVILITTKSPNKKDKVSINYSNNFAWSSATVLPQFAHNVPAIEASLQAYYRNPTASNSKTEVGGMKYTDLLPLAQAWATQHNGKVYDSYRELRPYVDANDVGDYLVTEDGNWLRYAEWDIQKTLFNSATPSQKHNVSLEGTSGKTQYRLSFGYDSKEGLQKYSPDEMNRYMGNANISTEFSTWLKAGTRISFTNRDYYSPQLSRNSYQYLWRWPTYMETYGYIINPEDGEPLTFRNDIMNRTQAYRSKTTTRKSRIQAWANAEVIKGLNIQADFTYDYTTTASQSAYLIFKGWNGWGNAYTIYQSPTAGQPSTDARKSFSDSDRWTFNAYATYAKTFANDHNLKLMAGATAERYRYNYLYVDRNGLVDYSLPNLSLTDGGDNDQHTISSSDTHRATAGFFGRANYDYKGLYLFEANLRYDGSSRFPSKQQWAWFPSVSAGYRFSEEAYFAPLKSIISNGKFRASYGHIGNENVGSNAFISTISLGSQNVSWLNASGTKLNGAGTPSLVSETLTWERIATTDFGLDLGLLNNSINISFDYYIRNTMDMLAPGMPLPSVLGASTPLRNAGSLRTNGWEFSIGWNHSFGDAQIYANFNLADAKSKVTKWDSNADNTIYSWTSGKSGYLFYEGQTFGDIWGFEFDRFFEESDFSGKDSSGKWIYGEGTPDQSYLAYNPFSFGPGDVKFKDLNGDGVINNGDSNMRDEDGNLIPVGTLRNHGDLKVIGNALPRYEYSWHLGGSYKGFDVDFFFQGVGKRSMWQISSFTIPFAQTNDGLFDHQLDYNKYIVDENGTITGYDINQNNFYPAMYAGTFGYNSRMRATCDQGINNFTCSDRYLVNMAYLRMKNITVGYTIPTNLTQKAYIQRARVYFSADNPFFIYNGAGRYNIDPEMAAGEASSTYSSSGVASFGRANPMMKTYSFGIQVTF